MPPPHILLVDDDDAFRPALQKTLEKLGYVVTASPNGADAKRRLLAGAFDLVISDIRMPEMNGIELTQFVKTLMRKIPVILITGFSDILEARTAYDLGAHAFLPKPIERRDLSNAIHDCLGSIPDPLPAEDEADSFCRLGIDDFTTGAQIQYSVFLQLSEKKFVKIAHRGEDLSMGQIGTFKEKGLRHLFLRAEDFRAYVGFGVSQAGAPGNDRKVPREKKAKLLRQTDEIIQAQINHEGIDPEMYAAAASFVQSAIQVIAEDPDVFALLEILNSHPDFAYAHGVGSSLFGIVIAQKVAWSMPTNRFKVAMAGLLHDIGEKEIPREILLKPRAAWTKNDIEIFETHPERGATLLASVRSIPLDVLQVAKQHHENCNGMGFPDHLRKNRIHPMARLVSIASELCSYIVRSENGPGMPPRDAVTRMRALWADRLDSEFFGALTEIFPTDQAAAVWRRG